MYYNEFNILINLLSLPKNILNYVDIILYNFIILLKCNNFYMLNRLVQLL